MSALDGSVDVGCIAGRWIGHGSGRGMCPLWILLYISICITLYLSIHLFSVYMLYIYVYSVSGVAGAFLYGIGNPAR